MIVYTCVMLVVAGVMGLMAVQIYKGRTDLIHSYHQTKVMDKTAYGKAFGKAMGSIACTMALSGGIALLGEHAMWYAIAALLVGLASGIFAMIRVQKKFNRGVF